MGKCHAILLGMKLALIFLLVLLTPFKEVKAKNCVKGPIKIAVIDTGFGYLDRGHDVRLCKFGHKDFTSDRQFTTTFGTNVPIPVDLHSHGTNVAGLINQHAKEGNLDYCLVIIKYYSDQQNGKQNLARSIQAIQYAANIKADYVNYSGGGECFNFKEYGAVANYLNGGGHLIAAAGNDNKELSPIPAEMQPMPANLEDFKPELLPKTEQYFPALYDPRIVVVGNYAEEGKKAPSSNFGHYVTRWEIGTRLNVYGITMTGTSQATAVATGKIVSEIKNKCDIGLQ